MAANTLFVTSKDNLKQYILKKLGYPVVNIEVTDDQLDIIINLAIEKWVMFAESGTMLRFQNLSLSPGVQEYSMSFDTYAIIYVFDTTNIKLDVPFPNRFLSDFFGAVQRKADLITLEFARNFLENVDFMLRVRIQFDYNAATRTLWLWEAPSQPVLAGILYYARPDYTTSTSMIYDEPWIKKYTTALARQQWADNLLKYSGSVLPTGLQMNAEAILTRANEEIEKLDLELEEVWKLPTDFYIAIFPWLIAIGGSLLTFSSRLWF